MINQQNLIKHNTEQRKHLYYYPSRTLRIFPNLNIDLSPSSLSHTLLTDIVPHITTLSQTTKAATATTPPTTTPIISPFPLPLTTPFVNSVPLYPPAVPFPLSTPVGTAIGLGNPLPVVLPTVGLAEVVLDLTPTGTVPLNCAFLHQTLLISTGVVLISAGFCAMKSADPDCVPASSRKAWHVMELKGSVELELRARPHRGDGALGVKG
jgi:hypothetical protein